jgi:DNA-binding GntR family transcriptional regulator
MTALQPVKAESLSVQVADSIREAIFRGELKPGQVLRELGLARNLNVSQATVREALSQLEHYGLVVRTPNRSTSVTSLSMTEVRDRIRVRVALECLAFSDAAQRATPEQLAELDHLAARIKEKAASKDSFEMMKADRRFHQLVW